MVIKSSDLLKVYHISRNHWSRLETRTVKNVCAPAAVIEDKIYIVGGEPSFLSVSLSYCNISLHFNSTNSSFQAPKIQVSYS